MSEDSEEKPFEPSQKKLDDARRKGEVAKSQDLITASAYGGLLLACVALGAPTIAAFGSALTALIDRADRLAPVWFEQSAATLAVPLARDLAAPLALWFGVPALAALLAIVGQHAFVMATEKLRPKLNRISPLANAKNKFGRSGLMEFVKSFAKLSIYSIALGGFLFGRMDAILGTVMLEPRQALVVLARLSLGFLAIVFAVAGAIGLLDYLWQRTEHLRRNRMSRKEMTDESKQTEGDPHIKQQRRQKAQEIAMNQMLADVPNADVIVVNPEHYAVALTWSRQPGAAPVCVAKGVDNVAARIREVAVEAGVPLFRDPPTARALFATVEIGQEIAPDQYRAVAAAIRFAEAMRAKARVR